MNVQRRILNKVFCQFINWRSEAISSFDVQKKVLFPLPVLRPAQAGLRRVDSLQAKHLSFDLEAFRPRDLSTSSSRVAQGRGALDRQPDYVSSQKSF